MNTREICRNYLIFIIQCRDDRHQIRRSVLLGLVGLEAAPVFAVAGAFVFLTSTFVPAAISISTKLAAHEALGQQPAAADFQEEARFVLTNSLDAFAGEALSEHVEEAARPKADPAGIDQRGVHDLLLRELREPRRGVAERLVGTGRCSPGGEDKTHLVHLRRNGRWESVSLAISAAFDVDLRVAIINLDYLGGRCGYDQPCQSGGWNLLSVALRKSGIQRRYRQRGLYLMREGPNRLTQGVQSHPGAVGAVLM